MLFDDKENIVRKIAKRGKGKSTNRVPKTMAVAMAAASLDCAKSQKLILPIKRSSLTASWNTQAYLDHFKWEHCGLDLVSLQESEDAPLDRTVTSLGYGQIIDVGRDLVLGNVAIVQYPEAYNHDTTRISTVAAKYCHLERIRVRKGQEVTPETIIGVYGCTGNAPISPHLHLEIDTDINNPYTTLSVKRSNFLKRALKGNKLLFMFNPMEVLHVGAEQTFTFADSCFIREEDRKLPAKES